MPTRKSQPEVEPTLPIELGPISNGEFIPPPPDPALTRAATLAMEQAGEHARRLALPRRRFLAGARGVATTLLALNQAAGCRRGGSFELHPEAPLDADAAADTLAGDEFVFDVHMHHVNPARLWRDHHGLISIKTFLQLMPQAKCGEEDRLDCLGVEPFIKEVFLDSDTDVGVLSIVPALPEAQVLTDEEAAATRELVDDRVGRNRLLTHGVVLPNVAPHKAQLERMQYQKEELGVRAWKVYTQWGPDGRGFWLDDPEVGLPLIEQARALGVKTLCVHKGLLLPGFVKKYGSCRDVGVVARMYPDMDFMVYHSGYEVGRTERGYDPEAPNERGIDSLVQSLADNGVLPNTNVYADLGSTWHHAMKHPTEAAHVLGKLLRYVGVYRVVWGTDSIWYGSPQSQIEGFRAFQISEEFQERYGYHRLDDHIRRRVLGLNAAKPYGLDPVAVVEAIEQDDIGKAKAAAREQPMPTLATYGPRSRREWMKLRALHGPI